MPFWKPPPPPPPPPAPENVLGPLIGMPQADDSKVLGSVAAVVIVGLLLASKQARKGLFTHEDVFNFHKMLGFACLISYAVRFAKTGDRDMGFSSSSMTLVSIVLHMTLSVSSLIFKIPTKRTLSHYRIWPEYRLHSIVFAWRSLLTMLLTWVEGRFGLEPMYPLNTLITLLCFSASDYASYCVGENASRSIRDLDVPPVVQFAFSWIQFHGTFNCILGGSARRYSTLFIYVWIIQVNAFLMTVQRKNVLSSGPLLAIYAFMLSFGYCVISGEMLRVGWPLFLASNAIGNVAAILRMSGSWLGSKKYLMWSLVGLFTHFARPTFDVEVSEYFNEWLGACVATYGVVGLLGYRKISRKYYAKSEKGGWKGSEAKSA